jgi:hypothetical protein
MNLEKLWMVMKIKSFFQSVRQSINQVINVEDYNIALVIKNFFFTILLPVLRAHSKLIEPVTRIKGEEEMK